MLSESTLNRILDALPRLRIAVVGDLFLDKYLDLDDRLTEISVETGLAAYQATGVRCYAGAAGTVLNNLAALGVGRLTAVSVIGHDGEGHELLRALRSRGVHTDGFVISSDERMTPTYTKPMLRAADGSIRELNRLDIKNRSPLPADLERDVITRLDQVVQEVDALIVADQVTERNHGVTTDAVRTRLTELARRHPEVLVLADSRSFIGLFTGCTTKPNTPELLRAVGREPVESAPLETVQAAAHELSRTTGAPVFSTRGPAGILYVSGGETTTIPGVTVPGPLDICGAGDATTSGIVTALCAGASPAEAARFGCLVSSITIQQLGVTGTATPTQVRARWRESV